MNEQRMLQIVKRLMDDPTPVLLATDTAGAAIYAVCLIMAAELPGLGAATVQLFKHLQDLFLVEIRKISADYAGMLEQGYADANDPIALDIMSSSELVSVNLTLREVWFIISALQTVTRLPELPADMLKRIEDVGRHMQQQIASAHPDANAILEAGWDPKQDVPQ